MDRHTATCVISCDSAEILRQLEQRAAEATNLEGTVVGTLRSFPGGVERQIVTSYRLGDYFDRIESIRDESDGAPFLRLVFHVRQGVDPYWKNLVIAVLRSVCEGLTGASVTSIAQSA